MKLISSIDGFYEFRSTYSSIAYLRQCKKIEIRLLYTDLFNIGQGHAEAILSEFLLQCDELGIEAVYLTPVVTHDNMCKNRLIALYERHGFAVNKDPYIDHDCFSVGVDGSYVRFLNKEYKNGCS